MGGLESTGDEEGCAEELNQVAGCVAASKAAGCVLSASAAALASASAVARAASASLDLVLALALVFALGLALGYC